MSVTRWYIERAGTEYGPVTWDELQDLARRGRVRPTDMVRRDGVPYWQPAHEVRADEATDAAPEPAPIVARESGGARTCDTPNAAPEPAAGAAPAPEPPTARMNDVSAAPDVGVVAAVAADPHADVAPAKAGTVALALLLGVAGLFWFGLLLGGVAAALATGALRSAPRTPGSSLRRFALAALLLGVADVAIIVTTLVARFHGQVRGFWH